MTRMLDAVVVAALVATGGLAAAPASAGVACDTRGACGVVSLRTDSERNLTIAGGWPATASNTRVLLRGESSKMYFRDTDGFLVPTGCRGLLYTPTTRILIYPAGWNKISDGAVGSVKLDC